LAVQADGKLGYCQQGGDRPLGLPVQQNNWTSPTTPFAHRDFCIGAFLLAGREMAKLAKNMALRKSIVDRSGEVVGFEATRAVDGDVTTRWSAQTFPQYFTVDLGNVYRVTNLSFVPKDDRSYQFKVESGLDSPFEMIGVLLDRTTNTARGSHFAAVVPTQARYLRLTVTGIYGGGTDWVSVQEFGVFDAFHPKVNLARLKPISGSPGTPWSDANDGRLGSVWSSSSPPGDGDQRQLTVDLGSVQKVGRIRIYSPANRGASTVKLFSSTDGQHFRRFRMATLANTPAGQTLSFPAERTRYVRFAATGCYGVPYSVAEFEIFRP